MKEWKRRWKRPSDLGFRVVRWNNETEANMEAIILFGGRASGLRSRFLAWIEEILHHVCDRQCCTFVCVC